MKSMVISREKMCAWMQAYLKKHVIDFEERADVVVINVRQRRNGDFEITLDPGFVTQMPKEE